MNQLAFLSNLIPSNTFFKAFVAVLITKFNVFE